MKRKGYSIILALVICIGLTTTVWCEMFGGSAADPTGGGRLQPYPSLTPEAQACLAAGYDPAYGNINSTPPATATPTPVVKACEHEYVEEVTTEPTCKDEGVKTFTCSKCENSYTEPIPKSTVHDYVKTITKEPTCTETGIETLTCSVCGDVYESDLEALGHDYKNEITTQPTCTEKGIKTFTCSRCGDAYTEEVIALGHTEGEFEVTKEAGWFTVGEQVKKCTVCGEILVTEVIPTQYPMWYLYVGIGVLALIVATIVVLLIVKKKKKKM